MEKEFLNYKQSLAIKELGFNEPCLAGYIRFQGSETFELAFYKYRNVDFNTTSNIYVSAPLKQQAFKWFDENTSYQGFVTRSVKEGHFDWYITNEDDLDEDIECIEYYSSRQEAEEACINKLIEIAKNK